MIYFIFFNLNLIVAPDLSSSASLEAFIPADCLVYLKSGCQCKASLNKIKNTELIRLED